MKATRCMVVISVVFFAFGLGVLFEAKNSQGSPSEVGVARGTSKLNSAPVAAQALVGTAFTYQGRLNHQGEPANGGSDFQFELFDFAEGGVPLAGTLEMHNIQVTDGLFTVQLDFQDNVFNGDARWLQIGVKRTEQGGPFTSLSPRQVLTPTPYATFASSGPFWSLAGNSSTSSDADFLGTTDSRPLVFGTNGAKAVRIDKRGRNGIGTIKPEETIHVKGQIKTDGIVFPYGTVLQTSPDTTTQAIQGPFAGVIFALDVPGVFASYFSNAGGLSMYQRGNQQIGGRSRDGDY